MDKKRGIFQNMFFFEEHTHYGAWVDGMTMHKDDYTK